MINQIKQDLANSSNGTTIHNHGFSSHPWDESITVHGVLLFAETSGSLRKLVCDYQSYGWSIWIEGKMDGIPAAYLYREMK